MEVLHIVWDPQKEIDNMAKHHVSLEDAQFIFADPFRIDRRDDSEENTSGEDRRQSVGKVDETYFVVYTERDFGDHEQVRLIMARLATPAERKSYNGNDRKNNKGWSKAD
ncbi:hypothetical protein FACS1894109_20800 [Spirochaetia bacterium]|nr:hypothetical protein FACS1894109_20800 [Spirochaetia bacterium]